MRLFPSKQAIFGGRYANYTKERVLTESSLIDIYHNCHTNIERNFLLSGITTRHVPPDLTTTYKVLRTYMRAHGSNEFKPGRKSFHAVDDMIAKGLGLWRDGMGIKDIDETEKGEGEIEKDVDWEIEEEDVLTDL